MWTDVARKDFRDAFRSQSVSVVSMLVVVLSVGTLGFEFFRGPTAATPIRLIILLSGAFSWALPIIALVVSYGAILHERTSGSIRFLLGLPNSRAGIVAGKFVGRSSIVMAPVAGSLAIVGASMIVVGMSIPFVQYLGFFAVTTLFGLTFVSMGLAVSTVSESETRTIAIAVGLYFWFRLVWHVLRILAVYVSYGYLPVENQLPEWYFFAGRINPITAYLATTNYLFQPADVANPFVTMPPPSVTGILPSPWLELASMFGWGTFALVAGYYRFLTIDLQ